MQQLTRDEIDRIQAMYWGAKTNYLSKEGDMDEPYKIGERFYVDLSQFNRCKVKLLLTPLASISDDDAIEVAKIANVLPNNWFEYKKYSVDKVEHPNEGTEVRVLGYSVRITNDGQIYFYDYSRPTTAIAIHGIIDVLDYLRSKSYALPYKGQSLFELGIAIDKNKQNG